MIALYRKGRDLRQVKCVKDSNMEQLLQFAMPGDTIHSIPDDMTHTSDDVLRVIENQLSTSQGFVGV